MPPGHTVSGLQTVLTPGHCDAHPSFANEDAESQEVAELAQGHRAGTWVQAAAAPDPTTSPFATLPVAEGPRHGTLCRDCRCWVTVGSASDGTGREIGSSHREREVAWWEASGSLGCARDHVSLGGAQLQYRVFRCHPRS